MSSDDMFRCLSGRLSAPLTATVDDQLQAINLFKAHVKRELVDLNLVPRYVEALLLAVESSDASVSLLAFNVLGHLVKRVSMQNPDGSVLHSQSGPLIPILLLRLSDPRSLTRAQAKRALEAYYFAAANDVECALVDHSFKSNDIQLITHSVRWLEYIMREVNQQYDLTHLKPVLFDMISHLPHETVFNAILDLLFNFYSLPRNKLAQHTLAHEMESRGVPISTILKIMLRITGSDDIQSSAADHRPSHQKRADNLHLQHPLKPWDLEDPGKDLFGVDQDHQPHTSGLHALAANANIPDHDMSTTHESILSSAILQGNTNSSLIASDSPFIDTSDHSLADASNHNPSPKLEKLLEKAHYDLDPLIVSENVQDPSILENLAQTSIAVFIGKETEFNWAERETTILHWRMILRGNSFLQFPDTFLSCLRALAEGICKAITSLRTTLSTHGCQLVKECAMILRSSFDPIADIIAPSLVKLCSATKSIASNNANMALCAIYCNSSYNHRLLQRVYAASNDKNIQPRQYSTIWLQILLIRFSTNENFSSPHGASNITGSEVTCKVLTKLLADANAVVRQHAKDCYWCYAEAFPSDAEQLFNALDSKIARILEKSKPAGTSQPLTHARTITSKKPYVSIKQLVIEKNRELRAKQREQTLASFSRSRFTSESLIRSIDRPQRLGAPKRVVTMPLKTESHTNLLRNPSGESFLHSDPVIPSKLPAMSPDQRSINNTPFFKSPTEHSPTTSASPLTHNPHLSMIALLSSNEIRLVREGVEMLKLAILENNEIPRESMAPLYLISVREPNLLSPLLLATDTLFGKSAQLFNHADFFRICCILQSPIEHESVDQIILVMQVDHIHEAILTNLTYAISTRNILDDDNLSMQFIKYLSTIMKLIIDFLIVALDRIPISDTYLSKVSSLMFELVPMLQTTNAFDPLAQVLKKLYRINPPRFLSQMILLDPNTRADVDAAAEIDHTLDMKPTSSTRLDPASNWRQFIPPGHDFDTISPVKLPAFKGSPLGTEAEAAADGEVDAASVGFHEWSEQNSPAKNSVFSDHAAEPQPQPQPQLQPRTENHVRDASMDESDNSVHVQNDGDAPATADKGSADSLDGTMCTAGVNLQAGTKPEPMPDHTEDIGDDLMGVSVLHSGAKISISHVDHFNTHATDMTLEEPAVQAPSLSVARTSNDFIDDFASVNIKESVRPPVSQGQLNDLVTKLDPLNAISNKGHAIPIFEDRENSPQKVKSYSHSEFNWFNYHLTKLINQSKGEFLSHENPVEPFQELCGLLAVRSPSGDTFMALLNHLQLPTQYGADFEKYLTNEGYELLETSLTAFFNDLPSLRNAGIVGGLILIKQMLISKYHLHLEGVWSLLVRIAEGSSLGFEMSRALTEVFQETLTGIYTSRDLLETVLTSVKALDTKQHLLPHQALVLESISTILAMNSAEKLITATVAELIAREIHEYLSHPNVELRRIAVINYAQLVKISRHHDSTEMDSFASTINTLLSRLTLPQRKLVNHYSMI